jgi:hypothetical protein
VLAIGSATYEHMAHPATRITCMAHLIFTAVVSIWLPNQKTLPLCSIITRCPTLTLVPDALLQLDKFYEVTMRYQSAEVTFVSSSFSYRSPL